MSDFRAGLSTQFIIWVLSMVGIGAFNWALLSSGQRELSDSTAELQHKVNDLDAKVTKFIIDAEVQAKIGRAHV